MKPLFGLVLLLSLAGSARAADWYVDAVNGSNSNSGTSAADAWLTITHALQQVGPGPGADTVNVLPGIYDSALGEVFPLAIRNGLTLRGPAAGGAPNRGVAHLRGRGDLVEISLQGQVTAEVSGLTMEGLAPSTRGVWVSPPVSYTSPFTISLRDLQMIDCSIFCYIEAELFTSVLTLEHVEVTRGRVDMHVEGFADVDINLDRCVFLDSPWSGLYFETLGSEILLRVTLQRTRIEGSARHGIEGSGSPQQAYISVGYDCLIADNGLDGIDAGQFLAHRCTIASNGQVGFRGHGTLLDCNVYGNGDDVDVTGAPMIVSRSNIGDGDFRGVNGNISVDPLFRDPDHGDYRLGFGTDCVDAIPGLVSADLSGFPRGNDGDLDLVGAGDMGALELRTLDLPETLAIGEKLHIDYHAEIGTFGVLYLARTAQLPVPLATPFGDQWLPTGFLELVGTQKALTPHPMRRTIPIPEAPALVGQQFSFQALSRSSNAPQGAAWTDAATVTFTL